MSEGLLSTVPEAPSSAGPPWLVQLRSEAASLLHRDGFPGKKHERWRFTSVRDVVSTAFVPAESMPAGWQFTTGLAGVSVQPLHEVLAREPALLENVLGRIAPPEPFAALNSALFREGILVHIARGARPAEPIRITHVARGGAEPTACYPRVVVIAEPESEAVLIESYLASDGPKHLTNVVTEVSVGAGARLDHTRATYGAAGETHLAHLAVRQERQSRYVSHVVALGGTLSRLEIDLSFAGEGAEAELDGVYHVDREEHVDHHLRVDHASGHCTSRVRYRGLLDGKGHAVFDAIGIVRPGASGSSAHQENRNLLLSDDAIIDTKPHLEIETDEVKASHGTAIGAVDDRQLFYLRSRGIPEAQARDVLTFAFVRALIERIPHAETASTLSGAVLARLPSGASMKELAP